MKRLRSETRITHDGTENEVSNQFVGRDKTPAFLTPLPLNPQSKRCPSNRNVCRCVAEHLAGYTPIMEVFKGVVIGPTVNEFTAAMAGGTVGVMGTLIALEAGRQKAKERKQCPYCRKYFARNL